MSKNFKVILLWFVFICLSLYFYALSFPMREALNVANQKAKLAIGISWQSDSFIDFGIVARFDKTEIFSQNVPVASFKDAYFINFGAVIVGIFNDVTPTQKIVDFSASNVIAIYSPFMPSSLSLFAIGDFGSLSAKLSSGLFDISIDPSAKFREFKNSALGSKIFGNFKSTPKGLEAEYAF